VDDVNEMDESMDTVEEPLGSMRRREFLTTAAAAGAVAWAAPVILSRPVFADEVGGGSPRCQPTIQLVCSRITCGQGNKFFPGIRIEVGPCKCDDPAKCPTVCVKITNIRTNMQNFCIQAYGKDTDCSPIQAGGKDDLKSTGNWECIDPGETVFFGKARSAGGAISELPDETEICFRLGVWAGNCDDADPTNTDAAFTCKTYDFKIVWDMQGARGGKATCTCFNTTNPLDSFCTTGKTSPCGTCTPTSSCPPPGPVTPPDEVVTCDLSTAPTCPEQNDCPPEP
jgi:hypothetical protein